MKIEALARQYRIDKPEKFKLSDIDPGDSAGLAIDKDEAKTMLQDSIQKLSDYQDKLYAQDRWAVLAVFQAMDAAGKDGVIKHVMSGINPQGCQVFSFKAPSSHELDHDFMWRTTISMPERGRIGIFNRSYYEAVIVERVKAIASPEEVVSRYPHINDFELLLTQSQTIVAKFFLHITAETQRERLLARQEEVEKWWKLSLGDWQEREYWDAYMEAYQAAIAATSTPAAPWYVVPSDRKWFRNLAVAEALAETLRPLRDGWQTALRERGEAELALLREAGFAAQTPARDAVP